MPTAVPIDPEKLLEAARDFANHQGGAGRPRPIWLRRAASSAYYALFHAIALDAAGRILPTCTTQERHRAARSFDHGAIRDVCAWVAARGSAPAHSQPLVLTLRNGPIDDVANVFIDLQELRHAADYDHLAPFPKATVLASIQDADHAMRKLAQAPARDQEAFYALLSLKPTIR